MADVCSICKQPFSTPESHERCVKARCCKGCGKWFRLPVRNRVWCSRQCQLEAAERRLEALRLKPKRARKEKAEW